MLKQSLGWQLVLGLLLPLLLLVLLVGSLPVYADDPDTLHYEVHLRGTLAWPDILWRYSS